MDSCDQLITHYYSHLSQKSFENAPLNLSDGSYDVMINNEEIMKRKAKHARLGFLKK